MFILHQFTSLQLHPIALDIDASNDQFTVFFPVIILHFSSFTPYYPNPASLTYFLASCVPQALEEQAVALPLRHTPLKRIIYIAQVWDQSNLGGTIEYTNLRSDVSLAEGRRTVSAARRDRE